MKTHVACALLAAFAMGGMVGPGQSQPAPKSRGARHVSDTAPTQPPAPAPTDTAAPAASPLTPGWAARCTSASREAPPECAIEQSAVLSKTGQLIVLVNIRVPSDAHAPVALVQLPLGLDLPAGARIQIDDGKTTDLQIQTCETRGCYANTPVTPEMLAALKSGKQMKVSFQTLNKETVTIPMPLGDFAAAYDKIK